MPTASRNTVASVAVFPMATATIAAEIRCIGVSEIITHNVPHEKNKHIEKLAN